MSTELSKYGFEVFPASTSLAYPSTNSLNGGQVNSEKNIRYIMLRLTRKSFVLPPEKYDNDSIYVDEDGNVENSARTSYEVLGAFDLSVDETDKHKMYISSGECNVDGYYFKCSNDKTEIDFSTLKDEHKSALQEALQKTEDNTLYVVFSTRVDAEGHLLYYTKANGVSSNFEGVVISFTDEKPNNEELWLGSITFTDNTNLIIDHVENNENKFMYINGDNIYIDNSSYPNVSNLYELIDWFIKHLLGDGLNQDLVVIGPDPANSDGTTNIYITNKNKLHSELLRLYYNPTSHEGGLALYSDTVANNGMLIKEIFSFTGLTSSTNPRTTIGTKVTMSDNVTIKGTTTHRNSISIYDGEDATETSLYINSNGTITSKNTITGTKVYGAVWG